MSKVRINDLARELEVKSKAILDSLPQVGVTEKKTHSSSLEEHEAEKVRAYFRAAAEAQPATSKSARPSRSEEEIKTKIDLSNISRPGDVLKAITQQKEAVAPPVKPTAPLPGPPAAIPTPPAAAKPGVVAPPKPPPVPVTPQPISPARLVTPVPKTVLPASPAAPVQVPPAPQRSAAPPATAASVNSVASAPAAPVAGSRPVAPHVPVASAAPPPRMIVPQTGPRPVYKAPPKPGQP